MRGSVSLVLLFSESTWLNFQAIVVSHQWTAKYNSVPAHILALSDKIVVTPLTLVTSIDKQQKNPLKQYSGFIVKSSRYFRVSFDVFVYIYFSLLDFTGL